MTVYLYEKQYLEDNAIVSKVLEFLPSDSDEAVYTLLGASPSWEHAIDAGLFTSSEGAFARFKLSDAQREFILSDLTQLNGYSRDGDTVTLAHSMDMQLLLFSLQEFALLKRVSSYSKLDFDLTPQFELLKEKLTKPSGGGGMPSPEGQNSQEKTPMAVYLIERNIFGATYYVVRKVKPADEEQDVSKVLAYYDDWQSAIVDCGLFTRDRLPGSDSPDTQAHYKFSESECAFIASFKDTPLVNVVSTQDVDTLIKLQDFELIRELATVDRRVTFEALPPLDILQSQLAVQSAVSKLEATGTEYENRNKPLDGYMRPCEACNGTGLIIFNPDNTRLCAVCDGTGIYTDDDDDIDALKTARDDAQAERDAYKTKVAEQGEMIRAIMTALGAPQSSAIDYVEWASLIKFTLDGSHKTNVSMQKEIDDLSKVVDDLEDELAIKQAQFTFHGKSTRIECKFLTNPTPQEIADCINAGWSVAFETRTAIRMESGKDIVEYFIRLERNLEHSPLGEEPLYVSKSFENIDYNRPVTEIVKQYGSEVVKQKVMSDLWNVGQKAYNGALNGIQPGDRVYHEFVPLELPEGDTDAEGTVYMSRIMDKIVPQMNAQEIVEVSQTTREADLENIRAKLNVAIKALPKGSAERETLKETWQHAQSLAWQVTDLEMHLSQAHASVEANSAMLEELKSKHDALLDELVGIKDDLLTVNLDNDDVLAVYHQAQEEYDQTATLLTTGEMIDALQWSSQEVDMLHTLLTLDTESEDPADYELDSIELANFRDDLRRMVAHFMGGGR